MQIELNDFKKPLIELKLENQALADRVKQKQTRDSIRANIYVIETILMWLNKSEKEGVIDMESLKIGLGKTVKLSDIKRGSRSKLDQAIIDEAEHLKNGEIGVDGREIDRKAIKNIQYFKNRVYQLAREGRIHPNAAPIENGDQLIIGLVEKHKGRGRAKQPTTK